MPRAARPVGSGAAGRQLAQAVKAGQARDLAAAFTAIENIHRADFPPAAPQRAPMADPVDRAALRRRHHAAAVAGISIFKRAARKAARAHAEYAAEAEAQQVMFLQEQQRAQLQIELDAEWERLRANDPDVVLAAVATAFEDNEAAAAPLGVDGDVLSVVVLVPGEDAPPERRPVSTPAGNLSLKKLTKSEAASWYYEMVCGYVLVTVKEALAVAPGIQTVRILAARKARVDAWGAPHAEAILAAVFARSTLQGVLWNRTPASVILTDTSAQTICVLAPRTAALIPLDLSANPEIAAALAAVDVSELTN